MKKFTLFFVAVIAWAGLFAQPHIQVIQDATGIDFVQHSVAYHSPGVYVIAGTVTPGPVSGASDILVLMADNGGNVIWSRYVDYGQDEFAGAVIVDGNLNIVLTGYTGINNTANKNLILVRLDSNGNYAGDVEITDPAFGTGMYGFDLEQTNAGNYILVGTGVQNATLSAQKYAFVLQVNNGLNVIQWSRIYRSNLTTCLSCPTNFDSFNHILKVTTSPTTPTGEAYLLTGSGADFTGRQMVVNDLIDPAVSGLSVWQQARGYNDANSGYPDTGVMALYRNASNEFYVVHPSLRTQPNVAVLSGNIGFVNSNWQMINVQSNFITGMVWKNPSVQDSIAFSGYMAISQSQPQPLAWPILFSTPISGPSAGEIRYLPSFNPFNYQAVPLDYIVRPLHANVSGFHYQYFYQPKGLVKEMAVSPRGYRFSAPRQANPTAPFALDFINTDNNGGVDPNCMESEGFGPEDYGVNQYTHFSSLSVNFMLLGAGANIDVASVANMLTCELSPAPAPRPFLGQNPEMGIEVYPNPANDFLYISGLSGSHNLEIGLFDMNGRELLSQPLQEGNNTKTLDVSTLESGVYFVKVSSDGKIVFVERLVKE